MAKTIISLSSLNGSNGFRLDGVAEWDFSGMSVSKAGDINGDGFDGVVIGSPKNNSNVGSSYVLFGKASGFSAKSDLTFLTGDNGFRLDGGRFLGVSVSSAGDVNGDGFDDVIIGSHGDRSSYVVFGKASGFDDAMNLSALNGNNGFRFDGLGDSVSSAGDINGDGFSDLIFGTQGASSVVFGKAGRFDAALDISSLNGSNGFRFNSTRNDIAGFFC